MRRRARAVSTALATIATEATRRAHPNSALTSLCTCLLSPSWLRRKAPKKAEGTEPRTSQPTSVRLTEPRRMCTPAPMGFMIRELTRSLATATFGSILKRSTSAGVIRAPPPMPVRPTAPPPTKPASIRRIALGWL